MKRRLAMALGAGIAYGLLTYRLLVQRGAAVQAMDFTYPWLASRALLRGIDPYAYVRTQPVPFTPTLFYPATAGLVALPFAWFSVRVAAAVFVGLGAAFLCFVVTKREQWRGLILATAPAYQVAWSVQWSFLLTASAVWPVTLGLVVAKPNLALPLLAYQTKSRAILFAAIGALALLGLSLLIEPTWPVHWRETLRASPANQYRIPILTLWGMPLSLAALRWRTREGRLLLAMACTPQNLFLYDQLPLLLTARTRVEILMLACCSWLVWGAQILHPVAAATPGELSTKLTPLVIVGVYFPALALVMRRPPLEARDAERNRSGLLT